MLFRKSVRATVRGRFLRVFFRGSPMPSWHCIALDGLESIFPEQEDGKWRVVFRMASGERIIPRDFLSPREASKVCHELGCFLVGIRGWHRTLKYLAGALFILFLYNLVASHPYMGTGQTGDTDVPPDKVDLKPGSLPVGTPGSAEAFLKERQARAIHPEQSGENRP